MDSPPNCKCQRILRTLFDRRDRFYHPTVEGVRKQSLTNRQGGDEPMDDATAKDFLPISIRPKALYKDYENLIEKGVSRELAQIRLPVSIYTEWYWKIDLHNLLRFYPPSNGPARAAGDPGFCQGDV